MVPVRFIAELFGCEVSWDASTRSVIISNMNKICITTGDKYHQNNCRYLKEHKIYVSLQEAVDNGYVPCKICCK